MLLGEEKLVDLPAPGSVFPVGDFLSDDLESERSITDPSVEVVGIVCVRTGDDDSRLEGAEHVRKKRGITVLI